MNRQDFTGLLYAVPSFWDGIARTLDVGGTFDSYNEATSEDEADYLALASDWYAVGADLSLAIDRFVSRTDREPTDARESGNN